MIYRKILIPFALIIMITTSANATLINLNDFFFFPGDPVTVAFDGSSATIAENGVLNVVLLSNDPGLGNPNIIIPNINIALSFSYKFVEGINSDDEFGVFVIDSSTRIICRFFFRIFH